MNVGVIGVGVMGTNHARVYSEMRGVDALYLYDMRLISPICNQFGATECDNILELVTSSDAISICTPTPSHESLARYCTKKGVPVLIEKPVCSSVEEARGLERDTDPQLISVGHIERFNPIIAEIKQIIRDPCYVEIKRHNPESSRISDTTVTHDLMIHDIDLLLHALFPDTPPSLTRSVGNGDVVGALFSGDCPVYLSASRRASCRVRSIYIEEDGFAVTGDFMRQEVLIHRKPGTARFDQGKYTQEGVIERVTVNKVEPLRRELQIFLDCVQTGKTFPVTLAQARQNLEVCQEIDNALC